MPINRLKVLKRKLLAATVMSICTVLAGYVLLTLVAGILVLHPRHMMMQWQLGKQELSVESWGSAVNSVELAAEFDLLNNEYIYDLGRLHEWRAIQYPVWTTTARKYRTQAIMYYRTALEHQPMWAQAWMQLAENKVLNQDLDVEVIHALNLALEYGPWEHGVHEKIIWLGVAIWDHLPEKTQNEVRKLIVDSLKMDRNVDFINNTAIHFKWNKHLDISPGNGIPLS